MNALMTQEGTALERYMAEVKKIPMLTREEEDVLARRFRDQGDVEAAHRLVTANLRFVVKVAYQYRAYGMRMLDLIQEGNLGLMRAVQKFNPDRGYRLISYAVWWIKAFLQAYVLRSFSMVKLGTTQAQRKLFFRLRSAKARLEQEAENRDEELTQEERTARLATEMGVERAEVNEMELRLAARDFSLDVEVGEDGKETHLDLLPGNIESQEESVGTREVRALLRQDVSRALQSLSEKERTIVEARLMSDDPPTLREIGEQWGVSRERARQIEANALKKLKGYLVANSRVLDDAITIN
ncbi:MAG: RNA polymerase factor sigma-32 [Deltaproteobacteria bacterium]|nr:RNA polymerase factor sigma-32 [Deltaproteobacteria bacterium]